MLPVAEQVALTQGNLGVLERDGRPRQQNHELALAVGGDAATCSTDVGRALEQFGEAGEPLPNVGERSRRVRPLGRGRARERRGLEQIAIGVALELQQVGADGIGGRLESPERVVDLVEVHGSVRYVGAGGSVAVPAGITPIQAL